MTIETVDLNNIDNKYFDEAWNLYIDSFPIEERRILEEQKIVVKDNRYKALGFVEEEKFVAILFYWDFKEYIFVEHFAINNTLRGKSYGSKIIEKFLTMHKNIVLEIEPIVDEITQKRFNFYKRFDFVINEHKHYQVPFRRDSEELELLLLSHKKPLAKEQYSKLYEIMKDALTIQNSQ